jgi:DNA-binding beta-propeller fold protein YncE
MKLKLQLVGFAASIAVLTCSQQLLAQHSPYTVVAVEAQAGRVSFYDSESGGKLSSIAVGSKPHEVEISPDGRTAYVTNFGIEDYDHRIGTPGNSISVIDVSAAKEKFKLFTENVRVSTGGTFSGTGPHGVKLRPHSKELFVNTEVGGDSMLVFDTRTQMLKRFFALPEGSHNFIFAQDGKFLYVFAGPAGVFKLDPRDGTILATKKLNTPVRGLNYTADGRSIIAAGNGEAVLLDPEDLTIQRHFTNLGVGQMLYPKPTSDGRFILLPAVNDSLLIVVDVKTGAVTRRLKVGSAPIALAISPDGQKAYVSSDSDPSFVVIDLHTFAFKEFAKAAGSNGIAITPQRPH